MSLHFLMGLSGSLPLISWYNKAPIVPTCRGVGLTGQIKAWIITGVYPSTVVGTLTGQPAREMPSLITSLTSRT